MKGLNAMIKAYAIHHCYVSTTTALVCFFQCEEDTFKSKSLAAFSLVAISFPRSILFEIRTNPGDEIEQTEWGTTPYHSQLSAATAGLKAFLMKRTDLNIVVRKKSVLQLRR